MPSRRRDLASPSLWVAGAVAGARLVPRRRRSPAPWLRFRVETAYGAERRTPTPHDLLTWLRWVRAWPRVRS